MLTKMTVSWAYTIMVDVDSEKASDRDYIVDIQIKAAKQAVELVQWKDGMVTDCEVFPQMVE